MRTPTLDIQIALAEKAAREARQHGARSIRYAMALEQLRALRIRRMRRDLRKRKRSAA